ncbi:MULTISPECIES: phospholipase D-like domain-containing protein [Mesorhizobium]|uniref:Phospholipase D n=1 Tax=Mesorhizobium japonicum (strain LMG 29417 / CECT 9101 / MAFF 303099) TaxID=266835 RepID=Q989R7_RHILO|nr:MULTISPECIES: phospholipase D-like domain-containing protein [Mesorhizobium]BAB52627.1 mlr6311 [Mesorhizobium japonicum MAFF 303099]BCG97190.1 hypothetical protein MesoLj131a_60540 [Mesorhizobium sp. 131-2-1]BCH04262.1 hypothetical protein MesoLj131b_62610 [Mesorhizobium sp. 131-2-5]
MKALAFSNNDIALVAWTYDRHLDGCLGFAIFRQDLTAGTEQALPAMARFAGFEDQKDATTEDAPIQKFWWKDLYVRRGSQVRYRIVPMGGTPGQLQPLKDAEPLLSNSVAVTADRGIFEAYFNRGIVATQAVTRALGDKANGNLLLKRVADPHDSVRIALEGELFKGVTSLLDQADRTAGAEIFSALYELNDPRGLEVRLQAHDHGDPKIRNVVLGNERGKKNGVEVDDADSDNRHNLHAAGVNVTDRILPDGSIPHNKFMVLEENGKPTKVLTGSTNWTSTGLATQTNNTLIIKSPLVAARYKEYWTSVKHFSELGADAPKKLQDPAFRQANREANAKAIANPMTLEDGSAHIEVLFSPNTEDLLQTPPKEIPNDMARLYELVGAAKHAVLFLAFDPGNNSILDAAGNALRNNPNLFVRGALTSTVRAANFAEALHAGSGDEQPGKAGFNVGVIGEDGGVKKAKGKVGAAPDYRAIPADAIDDAFGRWEKEIYKVGFAIIHNKVVVIDPFSDECVVITGSHNLGYRASHNNDENMVIVHGHRPLAEAYACHVLDLYDHYAYRYWLKKYPDTFGKPLSEKDDWQERYIKDSEEKSPELRFWLAATASAG